MTYDNRIAIRMALSSKRRDLIEAWIRAYEIGADSLAYWAERIQVMNDAEAAIDRMSFEAGRAEVAA